MSVTPACNGMCCTVFPYSTRLTEDHPLFALLEPLDADQVEYRFERFGVGDNFYNYSAEGLAESHGGAYMCREWDETTGLCRIYDSRPRMCSDYPYEGVCHHCGGTAEPDIIKAYRERKAENSNPTPQSARSG